MTAQQPPRGRNAGAGGRAAAGAALDVLLIDAATDRAPASRFFDGPAAVKVPLALARHPRRVTRRLRRFGSELARTARGASAQAPGPGDRRFSDAAWQENWLLHRLMQSSLASTELVDGLIDDAELDWRTERRARFASGNVLDALALTNHPWSNPAVVRETVNSGAANLLRGTRHLRRDVSRAPHLPASVDVSRFTVGENLAVRRGRSRCAPTSSSSFTVGRAPSRCTRSRCCSSRRRSTATTSLTSPRGQA
jgi:hypothetical protein